ncbi:MAG: hypothetical protein J6A75_06860 [Lachnospiraceae bacterium]|nr:hypothetical protein [Lachnospiraceae bacterium]
MRIVFKEYGIAIITALTALLIFSLIFIRLEWQGKTGIFSVLGAGASVKETNYSQYLDGKKILEVMEKERPEIICRDAAVVFGTAYQAKDLFMATDAEGNLAQLEIYKILDNFENEVTVTNGNFIFLNPGIYEIWVRATDNSCGVTEKRFSIPVVYR